MTSYADNQEGTIFVQKWAGYWGLVKENGRWPLNNPNLRNISTRVEFQ